MMALELFIADPRALPTKELSHILEDRGLSKWIRNSDNGADSRYPQRVLGSASWWMSIASPNLGEERATSSVLRKPHRPTKQPQDSGRNLAGHSCVLEVETDHSLKY